MRTNRSLHYSVFVAVFISGCNPSHPVISDEAAYVESIEQWQHARVERLKARDGWLNLAGLFWLEEGVNRFGSDTSNDIVFPQKADAFCGSLILSEGKVIIRVADGIRIAQVFPEENDDKEFMVTEMELQDEHSDSTTHLLQGDLAWYIINRGEKYGIRMRDYKHPGLDKLNHIPAYPINTDYVVEATLLPFEEPKTITVATPVEGYTKDYQCPGELHFRLNRKDLILYPFTSGEMYFLVIADETTGLETYGGGRFMYTIPDSTGKVILDFNQVYNPPCAFTPYATCPRPPKENFLPVAIRAGEQSVHLY